MKKLYKKFISFFIFIALIQTVFSQDKSYIYSWYKYYTPVEGKIVGIWPHINRWNDIERLKELKYRWGFDYILFWSGLGQEKFNMAKQIGYLPATNIMRLIELDNYLDATQFDKCWAYYLDEPGYKQIPYETVGTMRDWIKANFPNVLFIISGYKRDSDLINFTNAFADKVIFSSYVHWWELFGIWFSWPVNPDQREDWSDMKNLFGSKFSITQISANLDLSEYDNLLGHASNLGLEGIWLYHYNPGVEADNNNLESFSNAAFNHGFLYTNYQQVRDFYIDGNFTSRQFVGPSYFSIPQTYDHSNYTFANVNITNNRIDDYFASNSITAGEPYVYVIPNSKKSSLNSNNEIILKPGFHAQIGCEFRAYITEAIPVK